MVSSLWTSSVFFQLTLCPWNNVETMLKYCIPDFNWLHDSWQLRANDNDIGLCINENHTQNLLTKVTTVWQDVVYLQQFLFRWETKTINRIRFCIWPLSKFLRCLCEYHIGCQCTIDKYLWSKPPAMLANSYLIIYIIKLQMILYCTVL